MAKFIEDKDSKEVQETKKRLQDLGLGKITSLSYPWNPSKSPSICKKALEFENGATVEGGAPTEKCNEFIFTRA